ncbi:Rqc2 family fibronectin-binding protein [Anaerosinus massiliensis]|uniref:Rqc2 family fibronectin-binding protein n=1 Tax=Massilibacillus massiliensis TaxID=1806837 RepID=UPI000B08AFD1|nr:NFACT RNA binding domain-containing protein [Massilibacillus massiliensis]
MSLDGFSMYPLVNELNHCLAGGRIDKIFQPNKNTVILLVRKPGRNYSLHISIHPQNPVVHLSEKVIENPASPPTFCMVLRKQIEDGRIAEIRQHTLDRIICIDIDLRGIGGTIITKTLIIELMGKYSNLILLEDQLIIDAIKKIGSTTSRVRQVLPGLKYELPPGQDKLNLLEVSTQQALKRLQENQSLPLSKALIGTFVGIGPVTANEICWLSGIAKDIRVLDLSKSDMLSLEEALQHIVSQIKTNDIKPTVITDLQKKFVAIAPFPLHYLEKCVTHTFDTLSEALTFSSEIIGSYVIPDKEMLQKFVHAELIKLNHKLCILKEELQQSYDAEEFKIKADLLMAYQYQMEYNQNDTEVILPNLYNENPEKNLIKISINPLLTLAKNAQQYYAKYNKLKRAQKILEEQISLSQEEFLYLSSIENSLVSSTTLIEIHEIKAELISGGYLKEEKKKKFYEKKSTPIKIIAPDHTTILIGKNNYQNDNLTFKQAHYNDFWLHTKDIPGSHVIIRCELAEPTEATLLLAAQLSAYFSKAQNSSNVAVDYTRRRYVKKPAKAKPGFVIYTNQKTIYVTPDQEFIEKLLSQGEIKQEKD